MNKKTKIEVHQSEIDSNLRIELKKISPDSPELLNHVNKAHRDDHYIFFFQEKGTTELMIDFQNYILKDNSICFICPGQVHNYTKLLNVEGWFIFLETDMIIEDYRAVFQSNEHVKHTTVLSEANPSIAVIQLLEKHLTLDQNHINKNIINSLTSTIIGMIASEFVYNDKSYLELSRKKSLASDFKIKLRENYLSLKKPKDYASLLNISVPYLNEIIKEQTGYSPTYWINDEILLEAKRLLYYTQKSSKEIAFLLNYDDYAYFSRFFKKNTGITPLDFRNKYFDLSNTNL